MNLPWGCPGERKCPSWVLTVIDYHYNGRFKKVKIENIWQGPFWDADFLKYPGKVKLGFNWHFLLTGTGGEAMGTCGA